MVRKTRKTRKTPRKFNLRRKANQVARSIRKRLVKTERSVAKKFKKFIAKKTRGGRKSRSNMFIDPHAFNIIY
jgi:hypothetical protein